MNELEQSELLFGAYDEDKFYGDIEWHPVEDKLFWSVKLDDIKINGFSFGFCFDKDCLITPDSGTSLMTVPSWAYCDVKLQMPYKENCESKNDFGILTVDEKFNKGVGVNLTPPPNIAGIQLESIMTRIERVATVLGVQQYARVDAIFDRHENILYILECNTLPGLTAATVLFTQALHTPWLKLAPFEFLNSFITPGLRKMELEADVKGIAEFVSTALPSQLVRDLDGEGEGAHRGIIRVL